MISLLVTLLLAINHCYASKIDSFSSLFMVTSGSAGSNNSEKEGCSQRKCYAEDIKGTSNHDNSCSPKYMIDFRRKSMYKRAQYL